MLSTTHLLIFLICASGFSSAGVDEESCNPVQSKKECPSNNALGATLYEDFKDRTEDFMIYSTPEKVSFTDDGLVLSIDGRHQNPGVNSNFYIMFGKAEITLKAAPGTGIVSSFYLQSDALDEIDFEWFGGDPFEVQSNYFRKGNVTTYDRGGYHPVRSPQYEEHTYTIDWTEERLTWFIDSVPVRSLLNSSKEGFPQTPMKVFAGMWSGGDKQNSPGTISWAGGVTDYKGTPFEMIISKLIVADYSSGAMYRYGDKSGTWTSIQSIGGRINGRKNLAQAEFASLSNGEYLAQVDRRYLTEDTTDTYDRVEDTSDDDAEKTSDDQSFSEQKNSIVTEVHHQFQEHDSEGTPQPQVNGSSNLGRDKVLFCVLFCLSFVLPCIVFL